MGSWWRRSRAEPGTSNSGSRFPAGMTARKAKARSRSFAALRMTILKAVGMTILKAVRMTVLKAVRMTILKTD